MPPLRQQPQGSVQAIIEASGTDPTSTAPVAQSTGTAGAVPVETAPIVQPTVPAQADERLAYRTMVDENNNKQYLYSTTGKNTRAEFEAAGAQLNQTGELPPGFALADAGTFKSAFHTAVGPVRTALQDIDRGVPPLAALLGTAKRPQSGGGIGQFLANRPADTPMVTPPGDPNALPIMSTLLGSQLESPEKAGLFIGSLAAGPFLSTTTKLVEIGGKMVPAFNKTAMLGNMAKTVAAAGTGAVGADIATGEPMSPRLGLELGLTALGSTAQSFISHFITRAVPAQKQADVTKAVYDKMLTEYPQLKNTPNALDAYASIPDKLAGLGEQVSEGLRGSLDDVTKTLLTDIRAAFPANIPVGTQATYRARVRDIEKAGRAMLDTINDPKAFAAAQKTYHEAINEVGKLVQESVSSIVSPANRAQVAAMAQRQLNPIMTQHHDSLIKVQEGAQMLGYLHEAASGKAYDPMMFREPLLKSFKSPHSGPFTEDIRQTLAGGPGQSIRELPQYITRPEGTDEAIQGFMRSVLPILNKIPGLGGVGRTPVAHDMFKYQIPTTSWTSNAGTQAATQYGAQTAGQPAIEAFYRRK